MAKIKKSAGGADHKKPEKKAIGGTGAKSGNPKKSSNSGTTRGKKASTTLRIGVVGASGMLGKPVTRELIRAGFHVFILSRRPDEIKSIFPGAAGFRYADLRDPASLEEATRDLDALYLNLSVRPGEKPGDFHPEREGLRNLIKAARGNSVARIAYLSSLVKNYQGMNRFHWWVFDIKNQAVELVRKSGIPYVIFYPSSFMENFPGMMQSGNQLRLAGTSRHKMWYIAGEDYGRMVARAFSILQPQEIREYIIQGPDGLTTEAAAQIYRENYNAAALRIIKAPLGLIRFLGIISQEMRFTERIMCALNNYPESYLALPTNKELGSPRISMAQFAQNASAEKARQSG